MVSLRSHLAGIVAVVALLAGGSEIRADSVTGGSLLDRWFEAQSGIRTWSADLVQIRELKALKEPLRTEGRVWYSRPNRFRWEIGTPAQTVAVREDRALIVLYPRLKRAERYPLDDESTGQWRDALTLLESGFPRSRAQLEEQFEVGEPVVTGRNAVFAMVPKSASTRKLLTEVRIGFNIDDMLLRSTELRFADESGMKNEFSNGQANPELADDLFRAEIPEHFKVTEPLSDLRR